MNRKFLSCVLALSLLLFPSSISGVASAAGIPSPGFQSSQSPVFSSRSWALGVVAPEGAGLEGGGVLRWNAVSNVTALVVLPNIAFPDGIVYAVLSVMTSDSTVLQAAAGIYPNETVWYAYSWEVMNASSVQPAYRWILDGSAPGMLASAHISMSIFRSAGSWALKVLDSDSGGAAVKSFPGHEYESLETGDQEVFALESYTSNPESFKGMGNLTLQALLLDGQKVSSGFYPFGGWDAVHNPIFVVGSSGSKVPGYIALSLRPDGSAIWSTSVGWVDPPDPFTALLYTFSVLLVVGCGVLCLTVWFTRRRDTNGPSLPALPQSVRGRLGALPEHVVLR